jgi:hypothetical protein
MPYRSNAHPASRLRAIAYHGLLRYQEIDRGVGAMPGDLGVTSALSVVVTESLSKRVAVTRLPLAAPQQHPPALSGL